MRVAIYTISLNEELFVKRWVEHNKEADYLVVADTGSSDQTVNLLQQHGASVYNIGIKPWRFDTARNAALSLVPNNVDVCISVDMDEMMAPGWRSKLEQAWQAGTTRLRYKYVWSFDEQGQPQHSFFGDKCHHRWGYQWRRPVHETVFSANSDGETVVTDDSIVMWHKQDHTKSRGQYLPLLQLGHREDPTCSQTLFWLARELMYQQQTEQAITHLTKYLDLPSATWHEERSEAQRLLAQLMPHHKMQWLRQAVATAPARREPWLDLADHYYHQADWLNCLAAATECLRITHQAGNYLDTPTAWGAKPNDLAGIAAWNLGLKSLSVTHFEQAVVLAPHDERIRNNLAVVTQLA
jgi:tetratricopeptide (TPR) repeat protein